MPLPAAVRFDREQLMLATVALVLPRTAAADWGQEGWGDANWGEMFWSGSSFPPGAPSMDVGGLITLAAFLLLASWTLLAKGGSKTKSSDPSCTIHTHDSLEELDMQDRDLSQLQEMRLEMEHLRRELVELKQRPAFRLRDAITGLVSSRPLRGALVAAILVVAAASYAASISMPYTFSNGTVADANEVNANFGTVTTESNAQHGRLLALEAAVASIQGQVTSNAGNISILQSGVTTALAGVATNATDIGTNAAGITTNQTDIATNASDIGTNASDITTNTTDITANTTDIGALETTFSGVSRSGDLLTFSAMNVQVVDGSGDTAGAVNGLGNLMLGYNENTVAATRTGSHNFVVGVDHEYTSYAGLVAGKGSSIGGIAASVIGGSGNTASGDYASVSGGSGNTASGNYASISGGISNGSSGLYSSISGGKSGSASAEGATVSGGDNNKALNSYSSVSGGRNNRASGYNSSVSGGELNEATSFFTSISGGSDNRATSHWASASGGYGNTASGQSSSVSGGKRNEAGGLESSVGGGDNNSAGGNHSSVSGGSGRSVVGADDWKAGTLFEDN